MSNVAAYAPISCLVRQFQRSAGTGGARGIKLTGQRTVALGSGKVAKKKASSTSSRGQRGPPRKSFGVHGVVRHKPSLETNLYVRVSDVSQPFASERSTGMVSRRLFAMHLAGPVGS